MKAPTEPAKQIHAPAVLPCGVMLPADGEAKTFAAAMAEEAARIAAAEFIAAREAELLGV